MQHAQIEQIPHHAYCGLQSSTMGEMTVVDVLNQEWVWGGEATKANHADSLSRRE